jgi:hypothetical protein
VDLVIPLNANGQKFEDIELQFALLSIEKYLTGYNNIFIIGDHPKFNNGFTHIPAKDTPGRKQYSLMNKLMIAVEDERVSENFVYWHDDHFILHPLHVLEIKPWYDGTMKNAFNKAHGNYHESIKNTIEIVGEDALYYDIHVPCVFNKKKLRVISGGQWALKEYGFVIKSLYFNTFPEDSEYMKDLKIDQPLSMEAITELIKGRTFFSTGANGAGPQMIKKLNELYRQ